MTAITCLHCQFSFAPTAGRRPSSWCQRCGGDLTARPIGIAEPVEELVALTAAAAPARSAGGRWAKPPTTPPPTPAPQPTRTPAPAAGRWAKQQPLDRRQAAPTVGWSAALERQVEEQTAREVGAKPPAWYGYLFAGACLLVPLLTLGGAIPMVLGGSGASACVKIAHSHKMSMMAKLLACLAVSGLVWAVFITLLVVTVKMNQGVGEAESTRHGLVVVPVKVNQGTAPRR